MTGMDKRHLKNIPYIVLAASLIVMYGTPLGIPGIAQYWDGFKLLDMQLYYNLEAVADLLSHLSAAGIRHYLYYFAVDFCFIMALAAVQLRLSGWASSGNRRAYHFLAAFVLGRALFDLMEDALLSLIFTEKLTISTVPAASAATSLKFLCLFLWLITAVICTVKKRGRT